MIEKIIDILWNHVIEFSFGTGIVLLMIVWPYYTIMAVLIWLLLTAIDMIVGTTKAKYITNKYDSHIFGKAIMKRSLILIVWAVLMIIWRHLATFIDSPMIKVLVWAIGTGYFHLFSLQEFSSILEHWKDIDPENSVVILMSWLTSKIKDKVENTIGKHFKIICKLYEYLSPKVWKDYLR